MNGIKLHVFSGAWNRSILKFRSPFDKHLQDFSMQADHNDRAISLDATNSDSNDSSSAQYRDEVFARRVPAGKRTYFFDVKTTRSGDDFFITITESKRIDEHRYEKHKLFLYKEDFGKFVAAMHDVVRHVKCELLPDYDFRGLPEIPPVLVEKETSKDNHLDGF